MKKLFNKVKIVFLNLYYFRSLFKGLKFLQHLNVSNNKLIDLGRHGCSSSKKYLETIDLSNNKLMYGTIHFNSFFECLGSKKLYLNHNQINKFMNDWYFLDESLKFLDLKYNEIERLKVSLNFFSYYKNFKLL